VPVPTFPPASGDLLGSLVLILKSGLSTTAEERHQRLLDALRATDSADLDALLGRPAELALTARLVQALLDELDEWRPAAAAEVADLLGPLAPAIIGWPE
jgi:hypothetical protein